MTEADATPSPERLPRLFVAHTAEVGLKGGNRSRFERRLRDRIREAVSHAGARAKVAYGGGRFRVLLPGDAGGNARRLALAALLRVPGVANVAPAVEASGDLDAITDAAVAALAGAAPGSFKVETKRADKGFPMTSLDVSRAVAPALAARSGRRADVRRPDVTVRVEITPEGTFVSARRLPGAGGLPVGSTGRLLAFLSGGLDSPVAAWLMGRRGARVTAVHFHNRTLEGQAVLDKLEDLCGVLAWSLGPVRLLVVPFEACQRALVAAVPETHRMLVYRRAMFRIGGALARSERALGFVTGDSLGQVASQTASNLRTVQAAASLPVYMPLCGMDKTEIVAWARRLGTYDVSVRPHEDCCSFLVARHPATSSRDDEVEALEAPLDWPSLVGEAVERTQRHVVAPDLAALDRLATQGG
jgi:tRNA uracil 4-sulfurtransferase